MLQVDTADLHIHTCLSPCASLDMTPQKIVREANQKNLSIIAVTDHNSAENVEAVMRAARNTDLCVIPGIEITTSEEVHIVALFTSVENALSMQQIVFEHLLPGENNEDLFGIQVIANEFDEVEGFNKRLLIGATTLPVHKVIDAIHQFDGLAVAAHIDRDSFGIIAQLGFIPEDIEIDAVEISSRLTLQEARSQYKEYIKFSFITSSDAHLLEDVGVSTTRLLIANPDIHELSMALKSRDGRKIIMENHKY